jgi:drug/metabolite transporter (DMT)-like permease
MIAFRVLLITVLAMLAFAANSILCRLALKSASIDAATFTTIRLATGVAVLYLLIRIRGNRMSAGGGWLSAVALFTYAAAFSFAYVSLPAGTGALLLFGAVQATMIFAGLRNGEMLSIVQSTGLVLAIAGLIGLVLPGIAAPPLFGSVLMLCAGIAWGLYSLRGRGVTDPAAATAGNFMRATPFALLASAAALPWAHCNAQGALLAAMSGGIASGLGYVLWYAALPGLTATRAAVVQLSVPVIAAIGGIMFLDETISVRLAVASLATLGGIALVIGDRTRPIRRSS